MVKITTHEWSTLSVHCIPQVTALHLAAWFNSASAVKVIVEAGGDINACDDNQRTLLHYAAQFQDVDVVKMIINTSEADVRAVDKDDQTALHIAARYNPSGDVIRTLVDAGSLVDARADYDGHFTQWTPLHFAAKGNPSADVIHALVDNGADVYICDDKQQTPLHLAAR